MKDEDEELGLEIEEEEEPQGKAGNWLVTYADMVTLLLAFFVLLFSLSTIDQTEFTDSFTAIKKALTGEGAEIATSRITSREASTLVEQIELRRSIEQAQRKVYQEVRYLQSTKGLEGVVSAKLDKGKITLRLPSEVLFASGSAQLQPRGKEVVARLKSFFIKHADQTINIKGYTDDVPPGPGSRFRDNWELSAMRAVNVLRFLVSLGISPNRMTATGLADLEPLFPNNTPQNRSKNRRVEFVLERIVS
ncbi:OmpA/MotB family protein [Desulfohalovibrio reitneri]|uniref:OmpA/MotB family protein n=1 Tax=Desulfohalovibrio reitneri TaxID=1307759 RepID=UPI0004A77332|nr:flagellar motor protein MotB [Desulfohalovibrio reitneri]